MRSALWMIALSYLVLLHPNTVFAIELEARGEFVLEDTGEEGEWQGRFSINGKVITGTIASTEAVAGFPITLPVTGALYKDSIVFGGPLEESGPEIQFASDPIRGDQATGTILLGNRKGRWTATVRPLSGEVRPKAQLVSVDPDPMYDSPLPEDPCLQLEDPRIIRLTSAGGLASLERKCDGSPLGAGYSGYEGWGESALAYARSFLRQFRSWAIAQTPNKLANDPNSDPFPLITQNETTLAVSGSNTDIVLVGYNDIADWENSGIGWSRSVNGGSTWTDMGALLPGAGQVPFTDPVLSSNSVGTFFYTTVLDDPSDIGMIGVSRSTNGGVTFQVAEFADPSPLNDKPEMAIDPTNDNIYVCWHQIGGPIKFTRSTDNGLNYEPPIVISDPADNAAVTGCGVAASAGGNVFLTWYNNVHNEVRFRHIPNHGGGTPGPIVTVGQGFLPPLSACCAGRTVLNGDIRNVTVPSIASDPLDPQNVFITWDTYVSGSGEVYFATSGSLGVSGTWTNPPIRVNSVATGDQFQPRVASTVWFAAEPDTTAVRVVWYDRRNDPANIEIDVYSALTFDGGQTWQGDEKWTDEAFTVPQLCPYFECDSGIRDCYMGDYIAITNFLPDSSLFLAAWGDNRPPLASGQQVSCPDQTPRPVLTVDPNIQASGQGC